MKTQLTNAFESPYFASIDLGSNSFHLLIAKVSNDRLKTIKKVRKTVQIAQGLHKNKYLSADAQARALDCLACFRKLLRHIPAQQIRAVGTNALRSAKNAGSFIREAQEVLGHPIDVISGYEEARLIHLGVSHKFSAAKGKPLIIDIGGGSTEFIIGEGQRARFMESLNIGCVTYTDIYFSDNKNSIATTISKEMIAKAYHATCAEVALITRLYHQQGWDITIGSSGTIRAIAKLMPQNVATDTITRKGLNTLLDELQQSGRLSTLNNISARRASILPAGVIILSAIFDQLELDTIHVVKTALKEGLIYDVLSWLPMCNTRDKTIENEKPIKQYQTDTEQAQAIKQAIKVASS